MTRYIRNKVPDMNDVSNVKAEKRRMSSKLPKGGRLDER